MDNLIFELRCDFCKLDVADLLSPGRSAGSFPEQRLVMEPSTFVAHPETVTSPDQQHQKYIDSNNRGELEVVHDDRPRSLN